MVEEPEDLQWGIENDTGNWTGMMGMVVQKVGVMCSEARLNKSVKYNVRCVLISILTFFKIWFTTAFRLGFNFNSIKYKIKHCCGVLCLRFCPIVRKFNELLKSEI